VGTGLRNLDTDGITGQVIGAAIDVQRYRGPGMLEHTNEVCLEAAGSERSGGGERDLLRPLRHLGASVSPLLTF
jgi:hypothetical protein